MDRVEEANDPSSLPRLVSDWEDDGTIVQAIEGATTGGLRLPSPMIFRIVGGAGATASERPTMDSHPLTRPERPGTEHPGERGVLPARRLALAYVLALVLPWLVAGALIPLRADHGRTMAIVLVVPVIVTALFGATGPAVVSAISAGVAYDVLLTRPYYRLVIRDSDDVVAAVVLVVVGLTVGVLSSRVVHLAARSAARESELEQLVGFANAVAASTPDEELEREACVRIAAVLGLRECIWAPGYRGRDRPVLMPDGTIMGYQSALNPDRAKLPAETELVAATGSHELGRFVLTAGDSVTSYEERLTAATIASLYAAAVGATSDP